MSTCDASFNNEIKHSAAKQSCKECPFRKDNQNKPHAAEWFDPDNVIKLWRAIAHGSSLGCHMFDSPDLTGFNDIMKAEGYKPPTNIDGRKECAGTTGLIWREIEAAADYETYDEYHAARPFGLQRGAWAVVDRRLNGEDLALTKPAANSNADLIDLEKSIDMGSKWWKFSKEQMDSMITGLFEVAEEFGLDLSRKPCDCPVCQNHSDAHKMTDVQLADGSTAHVDEKLKPILEALAQAKIQTTASCEDLRDSIQQLAPELMEGVLAPPPATVNYAEAVTAGKAVVRFETDSTLSAPLIKALRDQGKFKTTVAVKEAQFTFYLTEQDELVGLINSLSAKESR